MSRMSRRFRRRRSNNNNGRQCNRSAVMGAPVQTPNTMKVWLNFVISEKFELVLANGFGLIRLSANNITNILPDSGETIGAYGLEPYFLHYKEYLVLKSHVEISLTGTSGEAIQLACVPYATLTDTVLTGATALAAQRYAKMIVVSGQNGQPRANLYHTINPKGQLFSINETTPFIGTRLQTPAKAAYWYIGVQAQENTQPPANPLTNITIKVKYLVQFGRRIGQVPPVPSVNKNLLKSYRPKSKDGFFRIEQKEYDSDETKADIAEVIKLGKKVSFLED